jgi:hypothetical protein
MKLRGIDTTARGLASVASKRRLLWRDERTLAILQIMPMRSLAMQEILQTAGKRLGNLYLSGRRYGQKARLTAHGACAPESG